jgi:hypothetical protein
MTVIARNTPISTDRNIVATVKAYVVYDRQTGDVLHIHHSVTFPHAHPTGESPETRALRLAGRKAGSNAAVLEVDPTEIDHRHPIRVDVAHGRVVRI